jgi:hypothetical protein
MCIPHIIDSFNTDSGGPLRFPKIRPCNMIVIIVLVDSNVPHVVGMYSRVGRRNFRRIVHATSNDILEMDVENSCVGGIIRCVVDAKYLKTFVKRFWAKWLQRKLTIFLVLCKTIESRMKREIVRYHIDRNIKKTFNAIFPCFFEFFLLTKKKT